MKTYLDSPNAKFRLSAIRHLCRVSDDIVAPKIQEMLRSDDEIERSFAVHCLALMNSDGSLSQLDQYMSDDQNAISTRVRAAEILLSVGRDDCLPFLFSVARNSQDISAYYAACAVKHHDRIEGFKLFEAFLTPDHPAAPVAALQIATEMGNVEMGFQTDALVHARQWLSDEIEKAR
ncbi:MAG TPA: HEAT repeat domain-containing protein [Planctomycetaceae bacterium]|nr:HEAT repeat domain-containing protein [Planctomycetaceae bacterium]